MFGLLCASAFAAWLLWVVLEGVKGLRRNVKAAKESGLTWFVARELTVSLVWVCPCGSGVPLYLNVQCFIEFFILRRFLFVSDWKDCCVLLYDVLSGDGRLLRSYQACI